MAIKHYEGHIGCFDYDDTQFELTTVQRIMFGESYDPKSEGYNCLHYCGDATNAEDIHIPEGIIDCTHMFFCTKSIVGLPEIPNSVQSCKHMFWGCKFSGNMPPIPATVKSIVRMFCECDIPKLPALPEQHINNIRLAKSQIEAEDVEVAAFNFTEEQVIAAVLCDSIIWTDESPDMPSYGIFVKDPEVNKSSPRKKRNSDNSSGMKKHKDITDLLMTKAKDKLDNWDKRPSVIMTRALAKITQRFDELSGTYSPNDDDIEPRQFVAKNGATEEEIKEEIKVETDRMLRERGTSKGGNSSNEEDLIDSALNHSLEEIMDAIPGPNISRKQEEKDDRPDAPTSLF